jgi:hypothetical protein
MDQQLLRSLGIEGDLDVDSSTTKGGPGKSTLTSKLTPAPQVVFRVSDPETARALGESFGSGSRPRIQREADSAAGARDGNGVMAGAEAAVDRAASSSGTALPAHIQRQFEGSLGADLSSVRVHTGSDSQEAAHAVGAKAYTVGNDIHFAAGRYQPDDPFGMHLLAHEVAHTVQQSGGAQRRQHKLEVSTPQDAAEHEADRAADAMVRGEAATVSGASGVARKLQRKDASFGGYAQTAETRGNVAAGAAVVGLVPVSISTDYAQGRAEAFSAKLGAFERGKIPGYTGSMTEHPMYKILQEIQKGYFKDIGEIPVGEGAYNNFVEPASIANKGMFKFRAMQAQLGISDEIDATEDLTPQQKAAMGKAIDKDKVAGLRTALTAKQDIVTGTRKDLVAAGTAMQAGIQGQRALLEQEKADAKEEDKKKIDDKIKSAKEVAEAVVKVVKIIVAIGGAAAGGAGVAKGAAPGAQAGGSKGAMDAAKEKGKDMAIDGGLDMVPSIVELAMESYYKEDKAALTRAIGDAKNAASAAKELDPKLRIEAELERIDAANTKMAGHVSEWIAANKALREYFVQAAAAAEKASGGKPGGVISQLMSLAAAAGEVRPHIDSGKSMATSAKASLKARLAAMTPHRNKMYGNVEDASYGVNKRESEGPDVGQIRACISAIEGWEKQADKDSMSLNRAESAVGV